MLAAHCVDFGGAAFELALDSQRHLQVHGGNQLGEEDTDGCIDRLARHALAYLATTPNELLLADISGFPADIAVYLVVLDPHAIAANAA